MAEARSLSEALDKLTRRPSPPADLQISESRVSINTTPTVIPPLRGVRVGPSTSVIDLRCNLLTDKSGVAFAKFLATNGTVTQMLLANNQIADETYLAMATALQTNTTLRVLALHDNKVENRDACDAAFVTALRINPKHPPDSLWELYTEGVNEYPRLKRLATSSKAVMASATKAIKHIESPPSPAASSVTTPSSSPPSTKARDSDHPSLLSLLLPSLTD